VTSADKPPKAHVAELEGWRGTAIIFLLVGHFGPFLLFPFGRLGVEFFFVLSGRLMAQLLFIDRMNLRDFYIRRFSRVFPAMWLFVVAAFAAGAVGWLKVDFVDLLRAVTFTINYTKTSSDLGHIWSLCVEEHSYLALSLIALLARRKPSLDPVMILTFLSLFCIINGAIQTRVLHHDYYSVYWRTDTRAASILISAAVFLAVREKRLSVSPSLAAAMVFVGIFLNLFYKVPDPIKYSLGSFCLSLGVARAEAFPALLRQVLSSRLLAAAGALSFSLYLWQQPFAFKDGSQALYLLMAVACAAASYFVIENPARRYLNGRFSPGDKKL
jgi:peptidoglycan/LPS O-acetylase OafA/YrhL